MPVFEHPTFGRTGDDKYMVVIEVEDPKFDDEATPKAFLKGVGGKSVTR